MRELPRIDEHGVEIAAPPEQVWAALGPVLTGTFSGARLPARVLGARPAASQGDPLTTGSTLTGFAVERATAPHELVLGGRHHFSRYALIFRLDRLGPARTRLRAETRAVLPGAAGAVYRALVIGTRGHVLVVKRVLAAVRRRAERAGA